MSAARYVLRLVPGVSIPGATYGSGNYGDQTYGQRASDIVTAYTYRIIPIPAGQPTQPAWLHRINDLSPPMQAQIWSEDGPLDLTAVAAGWYVLTPADQRATFPYLLELDVVDAANGIVQYVWKNISARVAPGVYRVTVMLQMLSTRRLTLPTDDNLRLAVVDVEAFHA